MFKRPFAMLSASLAALSVGLMGATTSMNNFAGAVDNMPNRSGRIRSGGKGKQLPRINPEKERARRKLAADYRANPVNKLTNWENTRWMRARAAAQRDGVAKAHLPKPEDFIGLAAKRRAAA